MKERSLKDEMRNAVRGDRERAEARRKVEAEGAPTVPPPKPPIDLNKPVTELKRPAPRPADPTPEPEPTHEPEQAIEPAPEPRRGLFARLFRR